jgi:hypothetical protein
MVARVVGWSGGGRGGGGVGAGGGGDAINSGATKNKGPPANTHQHMSQGRQNTAVQLLVVGAARISRSAHREDPAHSPC